MVSAAQNAALLEYNSDKNEAENDSRRELYQSRLRASSMEKEALDELLVEETVYTLFRLIFIVG